jgi:surface antigen
MLKSLTLAATAALALVVATGTAEARRNNARADNCGQSRGNEAAGAVAGAIIGGLIGNQVFKGERGLGTVAGVVLGGVAGAQLAKSGDNCDQVYASYAYEDAFNRDPYERVSWRNERSGNYGYVTPADYYEDRRGRTCREYEQEIYINGRRQIAEGVACQDRNGTWQIVK